MTMATPDELREELAGARAALRAALEAAPAAKWEVAPGTGEGEEAWSARQAAEHAVGAEAFFTTAVCTACGYPGVEAEKPSFSTPAEAVAGLDAMIELTNKKLKYVTEGDLEKKHERLGTSAAIMELMASHLHDHAAQILAAGS
jgi:hypothetical protein